MRSQPVPRPKRSGILCPCRNAPATTRATKRAITQQRPTCDVHIAGSHDHISAGPKFHCCFHYGCFPTGSDTVGWPESTSCCDRDFRAECCGRKCNCDVWRAKHCGYSIPPSQQPRRLRPRLHRRQTPRARLHRSRLFSSLTECCSSSASIYNVLASSAASLSAGCGSGFRQFVSGE